ncbi:HTH-type transcriptional regulator CatM [Castellaniella defragrans]
MAGELFLERTNRILEDIRTAMLDARQVGSGKSGYLTVGFIHSSTYGLLPDIIDPFRHQYPDIELDLREMSVNAQINALAQGVIDIGLLRPQPVPQGIEMHPIMNDPFVLAVPKGHRLSTRATAQLQEIDQEPLIMFSKEDSPLFHGRITGMCEKARVTCPVAQTATQIHTVMGLVGAGIGIAIVPGIARNLRSRNVRFLEISDELEPVQVALAWQQERETQHTGLLPARPAGCGSSQRKACGSHRESAGK